MKSQKVPECRGDAANSRAASTEAVSDASMGQKKMSKRERLERATAQVLDEAPDLSSLTERILGALQTYKPVEVPGMDPALHWLPPHISKSEWTALGNVVVSHEKTASTQATVSGERWMSLRLDGSNFSKVVKALRRRGLLERGGYSHRFAECMQKCLRGLMDKFHAQIGYTQSDEMMVLVPPANVVRGEQQCHSRGGRVMKTATLAAGYVTAMFVAELARLAQAGVVQANDKGGGESTDFLSELADIAPHFDCRVGSFASWQEARALLLWRAYDCSVNGVSDAVYQTKGSTKRVQALGKREKIEWLWHAQKLPLPKHQAYGTAMARVRRMTEGYNPKLQTTTLVYRRKVEPLAAGVLQLAISGHLNDPPKDEDQLSSAAAAVSGDDAADVETPAKAREGSTTASDATRISAHGAQDSGALNLPVELTSPGSRIKGENKSKLLLPGSRLETVIRAVREKCSTDHPEWALDARPAHIEVLRPRESRLPESEDLVSHRAGQLHGRRVQVCPLEVMNRRAVVIQTGRVDGYGNTHITVAYFRQGVTPDMLAEMQGVMARAVAENCSESGGSIDTVVVVDNRTP